MKYIILFFSGSPRPWMLPKAYSISRLWLVMADTLVSTARPQLPYLSSSWAPAALTKQYGKFVLTQLITPW